MTNREVVPDFLRRIPDDGSLQDIARELEFENWAVIKMKAGDSRESPAGNTDRKKR